MLRSCDGSWGTGIEKARLSSFGWCVFYGSRCRSTILLIRLRLDKGRNPAFRTSACCNSTPDAATHDGRAHTIRTDQHIVVTAVVNVLYFSIDNTKISDTTFAVTASDPIDDIL